MDKKMAENAIIGVVFTLLLTVFATVSASASTLTDKGTGSENITTLKQTTLKQTTLKQTNSRRRIERPLPPRRLPPNRVQPGGGLDVAARACTTEGPALTALVPVENPVFTAQDHPTFLFYFPDAPETVAYAEFILLSADEKEEIYSTQFSPMASGISSISLPAEASKALAVGEAYHWYLNLHCETTAGIPSVNGWVQRIAADELGAISGNVPGAVSTDSQLPDVWYDAIAQIAQIMTAHQQNTDAVDEPALVELAPAEKEWAQLLTAAGLSDLIGVPVVGGAAVNLSASSSTDL
ncbi:MAG: DUF928 domain-containing protein [Cyanobacteria bacterium J06621_11]